MLGYFGGYWDTWNYDRKVTFDGPNRIIRINYGVTYLEVQKDIYQAWKEWATYSEAYNAKYMKAIEVVGGEFISEGKQIATYFFLINGWRVQTYPWNHEIELDGTLLVEGGQPVFLPHPEGYSISTKYTIPMRSIINDITAGKNVDEETLQHIQSLRNYTALHAELDSYLNKDAWKADNIDMTETHNRIDAVGTKVNEVKTDVSAVQESVNTINDNVTSVNNKVIDVQNKLADVAGVIADIQAVVNTIPSETLTTAEHDKLMELVNTDLSAVSAMIDAVPNAVWNKVL